MMKENLIKFFNLIKNNKQAKGLLIVGTLLIFIFTLGFSLSMFTGNNSSKVANIKVNDLSFNITTNNATSNDRILHLKAGKTELFNVIITNLNNISTTYELIYDICTDSSCTNTLNSLPNGVKVEYLTENSDTLNGKMNNNNGTKTINIITTNTTSSDVYIRLNLNAGYDWNNLVLANQIKEYKNETNIIAHVDGVEQKNYPDNCNYTAEAKAYIGSQQVTLENLTVTCNKSTKKWTTNYTGYADRIEVKFTYIPLPTPKPFADDSWETIAAIVKENPTSYEVGSTKQVEIGGQKYTVRVANNTTPTECNDSSFSQTACGFVVEFVDIVEKRSMNGSATTGGGWPASEMRTYANGTFFYKLPSDLQRVIKETKVVSGHGTHDANSNSRADGNFESNDKIYLLSAHEVYKEGTDNEDTAWDYTRQLDYYANLKVTTSNYSGAIKKNINGYDSDWWLRAPLSYRDYLFLTVQSSGSLSSSSAANYYEIGFAPAFRIE